MSFRIGILGIQHESNTFLPGSTSFEAFERDVYAEGSAVIDRMRAAHHEMGGFIEAVAQAGSTVVPILFARALPSAPIDASTETRLIARAIELLKAAGPLDGLLVAPHGAGVGESDADFDGHWLSLVRETVGKTMPIVCTIDPHANLSESMIASCDATIAYRTNPHIDQRARGIEAANLLLKHLRGEAKLVQAAAMPPMAINIERQRTAVEPCASLYRRAEAIRAQPGVLSVSVVLGFPYADVHEMGSAFIVVCDGNREAANAHAQDLADWTMSHRERFLGQLLSVDAALRQAATTSGPSVLLDMGDNVGGGGPGTSNVLLAALHARSQGPTVATVFDAEIVRQATELGIGASGEFTLPGDERSQPLVLTARVQSLHDGKFTESKPRHGGATQFDMGPTAVLKTSCLTLIVTSRRLFPVSLEQYPACGLDVCDFRYFVAKGVHAPIAAYEPISPTFIHVNTPGVTSADLSQFNYRNRRQPLYPFESLT